MSSWMHLEDDPPHVIWSCRGCRRKAITATRIAPTPCDFCKPEQPKKGAKR